MDKTRALKAFNLQPTDHIPMYEHFSNPDAEYLITGIDPWEHPRLARERLYEVTYMDVGGVPASDDPIPRLPEDQSSFHDPDGRVAVRWGTGKSWHWDWGHLFPTIDDVLKYRPLEHLDLTNADVVENRDYSVSVDEMSRQFQAGLDYARQLAGDRCLVQAGFYNTIFMWPLLTFGWENFLELGIAYKEDCKRILADFAELSRKVFKALAMTDVEVVTSHDDICFQAGPVFSPDWLCEMIYPYYEEFWGGLKASGKKVLFVCDGNVDKVAADVFACGADGIVSEPYTNWREIARRHPDKILVGDGDNRVIASNDREAIFNMVKQMAEWGKRYPGYFFCIGNHISWELPAEGVKAYFDAAAEYGYR